MFKFFFSGIADIFDRDIKVKILASQRVVAIHSNNLVSHSSNSDRNSSALTSLCFKLHANFNTVYALKRISRNFLNKFFLNFAVSFSSSNSNNHCIANTFACQSAFEARNNIAGAM